jgi:RNA polymerase sigma factor for flagellar operon FliA
VLDELRSWSFAPSNLKKQFDQAQQVMQEMTETDGELPSDSDLADKLQMPVDKMYRMFENARARHFLSIHGLSDEAPALGESLAAHGDEPGEALQQQELIEQLARAIQKLPTKQRRIIILYYTRELTMKQIATTMEITESRVSQLHAAALGKLASRLKAWRDSMD